MSDLFGIDIEGAAKRLAKDLKLAALVLDRNEVRYLVSTYYAWQEQRIRADHQVRKLADRNAPHLVLSDVSAMSGLLEKKLAIALDAYTKASEIGRWARAHKGLGPVITAGLLAHIDIYRSTSAGQVWSFAGLNPEMRWEKGQKRPFNAELKVICWKLGESFKWVASHKEAYYGLVYRCRKLYEQEKNDKGLFADLAEHALKTRRISKATAAYAAYSKGKLPAGRIQLRAGRYAAKLFLAHLWETWRHLEGLTVELPYPIRALGHTHMITPYDARTDPMPELPFSLRRFATVIPEPDDEPMDGLAD